ncbi:MAG: PAS domain S-box protein [Bryobacteraceae bacterium]|nr:PAS domain S-box protein [Bryobacteraceae bacterium]
MSTPHCDLVVTENTFGVVYPIAKVRLATAMLKAVALQAAIFNSGSFSSIATDEKGVIHLFNAGAERMLGYTALEVVDKFTPADISDPEEGIARAKVLSLELATPITPGFEALVFKASRGIEDTYELTQIRKNGSRFPAIVSVTALRDERNGIIGYLLIGTDNTTRKRNEERIDSSQGARDLRAALDQHAMVAITNTEGKIIHVNDKFCAISQYSSVELLGKDHRIVSSGSHSKEFIRNLWTTISNGNVWKGELCNRAKEGAPYWVDTTIVPFLDAEGKPYQYVVIRADVTERHHAEHTAVLLGAIVNCSDDAIISKDLNGIITSWNNGARDLFGYTAEEAIGQSIFLLIPSDRLEEEPRILDCLRQGKRVEPFETVRRRKDGQLLEISLTISPVKDKSGLIAGGSTIARSIAERKRLERALHTNILELEIAKQTAEKANQAKSHFLAAMSHEIRTPMNAILGMSDMLAESPLDAEQMQYVEVFRRAGGNLMALINDILDLSKIEGGHLELEHLDFDLEALVDEAIEITAVKTHAKGPRPDVLPDARLSYLPARRLRPSQTSTD